MAKTPQEIRDEADQTESSASDKAERLRDAAAKQETANNAQKDADTAVREAEEDSE